MALLKTISAFFYLKKYKQDTPPLDPDDLIGGYQYQFSTWASLGYPTSIPIQYANSRLKIELTVEWL